MREYKLRDTRTSAFREMTGIEKTRLWSRARPLARSLGYSPHCLRPECRGHGGHIRPHLSLSLSIRLLFSYLLVPFFFHFLRPRRFIISTLNDVFTINADKRCVAYTSRDVTLSNDMVERALFFHAYRRNRVDFSC